jgi:outer membrane lipoprotein-sorting protein
MKSNKQASDLRAKPQKGMTMSRWRTGGAMLLVVVGASTSFAQGPKSWEPVVRLQSANSEEADRLTKRQVELVHLANGYFNKLTMLEGSFIQLSADGKRQRGKFHLMRPGRFRFDFAPPNRTVIISDGKYLSIQDYDLNTDDRRDLNQTPFRPLLSEHVDLLRDARIFDVTEAEDNVAIAFSDVSGENGNVRLFLAVKPAMQLKGWIIRDNQNLDTRVDLTDVQVASGIDPKLFDPSARLERRRW